MSDSQTSPDSMPESPAPGPSTGRARGRGARRSARGRGRRGRGRGSGRGMTLQLSPEDLQRMQDVQAQRIAYEDALIGRLDLQESHQMLRDVLHHDPSLVFDLRLRVSDGAPPVPPSTAATPSWCVCTRCREMPTDLERKCCGSRPEERMSTMPHMDIYILMEGHLRIARRLWNDVRAVEDSQNPGESNRQFRHAANRQWVVWQYGSLGSGRRVVIPSCCVWTIRDRFPDPNGQYVGFIPSRV